MVLPYQIFVKRTALPTSAQAVFDWHKQSDAFSRLTPPWEKIRLVSQSGSIENGDETVLEITVLGPVKLRWRAVHQHYEEGRQFEDVQAEGPFAHWRHTHRVEVVNETQCVLEDRIEYALPFGVLGALVGGWLVRRKLNALFDYRHQVMREAFR